MIQCENRNNTIGNENSIDELNGIYISVTIATPIMLPTNAIELHANDNILPAFSRSEESTLLEREG